MTFKLFAKWKMFGEMEEMAVLVGRGLSTSQSFGYLIAFVTPHLMVSLTWIRELRTELCASSRRKSKISKFQKKVFGSIPGWVVNLWLQCQKRHYPVTTAISMWAMERVW